MRFRYSFWLALPVLICFSSLAFAVDYVDVGNTSSEAGHNMLSWGPVEPFTSGGAYGGIDDCRAIWSSLDGSVNAFVDMDFGDGNNVQVAFKHLEGQADDSFNVFIDGVWQFTHTECTTTEIWFVSGFTVTVTPGIHTLEFVAVGPQWSSWATYGQMCFSDIWVGMDVVPDEADTWGGVKSLFR